MYKTRPQVRSKVVNVFLSWIGLALDWCQVSCQIDSLWIKAGIYEKDQVKGNCHLTLSKDELRWEPVMQEWLIIGRLQTCCHAT